VLDGEVDTESAWVTSYSSVYFPESTKDSRIGRTEPYRESEFLGDCI